MRPLLLVTLLLFALVPAGADPDVGQESPAPPAAAPTPAAAAAPTATSPKAERAPSEAKPKADASKSKADMRKLSAEQFKQCMQDWDAATHMTKTEWARTCRRVVDARVKFQLEHGTGSTLPTR
jgi:hypothetical protein